MTDHARPGKTAELDPRRYFTREQVWQAWRRQGERCNLCQRAIPVDLMHGDHVVAWSKGGPTTLANLQALCGSCNLRKGTDPQEVAAALFSPDLLAPGRGELRAWQRDALGGVLAALATEPVLVEACSGAGKTRFGLEVAWRLLVDGAISRVLVIVPTLGIADGWRLASSAMDRRCPTIPLRSPRDWRPADPIGDGWAGAITTYQSLFSATEMLLAHATDPGQRTLVIFDEVHHAGAGSGWGQAAQVAFAGSAWGILSLSGTPFRTERDPIVFVPSVGGAAQPQYRYSYSKALTDRACRPVQFVEARGTTTFRTEDGVVHSVTFDEAELTELGERRRLRTALEWIGPDSIAEKMLADANAYVLALRRAGDHDAGGLVVCIDCDHAAKVAAHMGERIVGRRPVVACSRTANRNDPEPANAVRQFALSQDPWIVAVNMVSEGVDIPRLRVVVYLTNRLTLLSFRQIVGRVVRSDEHNADDHGRVYLPADPTLVEMAHTITSEVEQLPIPIQIVVDGGDSRVVRIEGAPTDRVPFEALSTVGSQGSAFDTGGRSAHALLISCARRFIEREGLGGTDAESLAMAAAENEELRQALLALLPEVEEGTPTDTSAVAACEPLVVDPVAREPLVDDPVAGGAARPGEGAAGGAAGEAE